MWRRAPVITVPLIVWYQVFRSDHRWQDQGNALEAIWDAMQQAGVVENDRLIIPRAIGPILIDPERPRVELHLELWQEEIDRRAALRASASCEELHYLREFRPDERIHWCPPGR